MTEDAQPPFRVVYSESVRTSLHRMCEKAKKLGAGRDVLASLSQINDRLRAAPLEFGEPVYRLKKSKAKLRKAAVAPLVVCFGVYPRERFVVVFWIKALPGTNI